MGIIGTPACYRTRRGGGRGVSHKSAMLLVLGLALGLNSCAVPSHRGNAEVELGAADTERDRETRSSEEADEESKVDPGLRLVSVSPDGTKLTIGVEDDPCHPATVEGIEERRAEIRIKVAVRQPDLPPEAACLPMIRETRHTFQLDSSLDGRPIRRVGRVN